MGIPISISAPRKFPVVTVVLVIINVFVFIAMNLYPSLLLPRASSAYEVQSDLGLKPIDIVRGERLWTFLTSIFVHGDVIHLAGNMFFLFVFGAPIESAMGHGRYLLFYVLCGLIASIFHVTSVSFMPEEYLLSKALLSPWITPAIGASGAISGIIGAYLIYYPESRVTSIYPIWIVPVVLELPAWIYATIWFAYQLAMGLIVMAGIVTSIAYWAHIGGFLAGIALSSAFLDSKIKRWISIKNAIKERLRNISDYYVDEDFH